MSETILEDVTTEWSSKGWIGVSQVNQIHFKGEGMPGSRNSVSHSRETRSRKHRQV